MNSKTTNDSDKKSDLIFAICLAMVCVLLITLMGMGKGIAATVFTAGICVAVKASWELRKYVWYWVTVVLVVALHLALVLFMPWPNVAHPGLFYHLVFIGSVDFLIVYGLIGLVEKVRGKCSVLKN